MVRQALRYQVLDSSGVPIAGASIQVAQVGTTTNITQTMLCRVNRRNDYRQPSYNRRIRARSGVLSMVQTQWHYYVSR